MKNLFVCHTQAHLILATGLSYGRFCNDENHLILFRDFNLTDTLVEKLKVIFSTTLFLTGIYPSENQSFKARLRWYREDYNLLCRTVTKSYDRVFAVCDWTPPVQYCLKRCFDLNDKTEFNWLEDGILSYFPNIEATTGTERFKLTKFLRKVFFKYITRIGHIYERDFNAMGGLKVFKKMYTLYPEAVREPYKSSRELIRISDYEYFTGISQLYDRQNIEIEPNSILLLMDKLDTYQYPEKVKAVIKEIKILAKKEGRKIYCKLHPREESQWDEFGDFIMLNKIIGVESLYLSMIELKHTLQIYGFKSAGLMSAKKMGFCVNSVFLRCGEANQNLQSFFALLGIAFK